MMIYRTNNLPGYLYLGLYGKSLFDKSHERNRAFATNSNLLAPLSLLPDTDLIEFIV